MYPGMAEVKVKNYLPAFPDQSSRSLSGNAKHNLIAA